MKISMHIFAIGTGVATVLAAAPGLAGAGGVDQFTIGLEEVVSDGVPGAGAGNIEAAGNTDEYTLNVAAGTVVYFDELSGACNIAWNCTDSNGDTVFSDSGFCLGDPQAYELTLGGDYTITVFGEGTNTGTYSFTVWGVNPDDEFTIGLKSIVMDGVPGSGAGNIEEAGTSDVYTLNVTAGTVVFFEELAGACNIAWSCVDSNGDTVFNDSGFCLGTPGVHELTLGGDYTITATGEGAATGTYSFTVWDVNADDEFTIGLKEIISDGVPGPGAGNIEEAGTSDVYTLNVAAGTVAFFEELAGACNIAWSCVDSNGDTVFNDSGLCLGTPGSHELTLGGDYTITVTGEGAATGTYSFTVWNVNPVESFSIGLEEVVSDGAPGAGAGNIEEAGAIDVYTFSADPGEIVFFDELAGACNIAWSCVDSNGDTVFNDSGFCLGDPGVTELTLGGNYTVTVVGEAAATGTYSFTIWDVEPTDFFDIEYGETVADGVPGTGAGNIEEAGTLDVYTFMGEMGDEVCFTELSGSCSIRWVVEDPNADQLFLDTGFCLGDPGTFILPLTGVYTITVSGEGDATGTYSFVATLATTSDINEDCLVNVTDLLIILGAWGTPDGDVTGDGQTDVSDLLQVLGDWT